MLPRSTGTFRGLKQSLSCARTSVAWPKLVTQRKNSPSRWNSQAWSASHRRTADSTSVSSTSWRSKAERLITLSTSEVADCCSSASERCSRASVSSRVRASSLFSSSRACALSFFSSSAWGSRVRPVLVLAFALLERRRPPCVVRLFAPLRAKITSSAQSLVRSAQSRIEPINPNRTARRTRGASLDHLVSEREQIIGDFDAERLRGLEVDHRLELGRLMDRQLRGVGALENSRGVDAVLAVTLGDAHTVAQQSARDRILAKLVDRRQPLSRRESNDPIAARIEVRGGCDQQRLGALLH